MACKVRTKPDYKNNAPSVGGGNTSGLNQATSGLNREKTPEKPLKLGSFPGPKTEYLNNAVNSGVKESIPELIPVRGGRNYQTQRNLAQEDASARALRLANAACKRIAARLNEVDGRDAQSWLCSAITYCEWRGGRFPGSRAWADRNLRDEVDKAGYLAAVRLLNDALHCPDVVPMGLAAPVVNAAPAAPAIPEELKKRSRPSLVAELLLLRPELEEGRKSLARFTGAKLARMVDEARAAAAAVASERRRA